MIHQDTSGYVSDRKLTPNTIGNSLRKLTRSPPLRAVSAPPKRGPSRDRDGAPTRTRPTGGCVPCWIRRRSRATSCQEQLARSQRARSQRARSGRKGQCGAPPPTPGTCSVVSTVSRSSPLSEEELATRVCVHERLARRARGAA